MADLKSIVAKHNAHADAMLSTFEAHLREITMRAQGRVIARLHSKLSISEDKWHLYPPAGGGIIDSTAGNMAILRNAGKMFMQEMDRAGYQQLVTAFVGEFRGTLPFLQETLELLGNEVGQKWGTDLGFTSRDLSLLGGVQANTVAALEGAIEATAGAAITRGLFGVAGLKFGSLVDMLTTKFETSIAKARTIADTSTSIYYATASGRAFDLIAKDLPAQALRFDYSGPDDAIIRPFCKHLVESGKSYTREQIDLMDNGSLPNVWLTRGSWNCRHQWTLSVRTLVLPMTEAA